MATGTKFNEFTKDAANGVHKNALNADTDTLKIYLSNVTPNVATHKVKADLAEITIENGYTGPIDATNAATQTGSQITVTGVDIVVTASGGTVGPLQHSILYNDTPTSPLDPLICFWTRAAGAVTLQIGESFTTDFGASMFTFG